MSSLLQKTKRAEAIEELALFILYAAQEYRNAEYVGMQKSSARAEALARVRQRAINAVTKFANALNLSE